SSPATSTDARYNGLVMPTVSLTNTDNESSGGGGGGGGGGNNSGGTGGGSFSSSGGTGYVGGLPEVLGASTSTSCDYFLNDYLRQGRQNNPLEMIKLQLFLKNIEGFTNLQPTGVFDEATFVAV